jgi:hypothetical protein
LFDPHPPHFPLTTRGYLCRLFVQEWRAAEENLMGFKNRNNFIIYVYKFTHFKFKYKSGFTVIVNGSTS